MKYQPIIGLEVHVELATKSKMFCGCSAEHFGVAPNTHTCPVCLALPGALPVPNKKAIDWTILLAVALGCKINLESHFDRKNYFYPDLPKGYQITQYEQPFGEWGKIVIPAGSGISKNEEDSGRAALARMTKEIRIRRVHLEEDTGKLQHVNDMTLVDFNRSGVPLVEIVTEPDFRSIEEVDIYLKKLQKIIRYLGISNADMEKGSMRLEPSISLAVIPAESGISKNKEDSGRASLARMTTLDGLELPNYRVELKNINSFKFVKKALEYEIERQQKEPHIMQTRGWNEAKNATVPQREKEEAHDYRYFPEPDIPPIRMTNDQLAIIQSMIPELPDAKFERFKKQYSLSDYDAEQLTNDKNLADFFEQAMLDSKEITAKEIANWLINKKVDISQIVPGELVAKILAAKQTTTIDEKELEKIIDEVLAQNQKAVEDYKKGKEAALMFLFGQTIKRCPPVDKKIILDLLKQRING